MKKWYTLCVVAGMAAATSLTVSLPQSAASARHAMVPITIGVVSPNPTELEPTQMASRYFRAAGIKAKVSFLNDTTLTAAIATGRVQFAEFAAPSGDILHLSGAPTTILGDTIRQFAFRLVVAPGISKVADLRGKAIGVAGPESADRVFVELLLQRARIPESDVHIEIDQRSALAPSFSTGTIDAFAAAPPESDAAIASRPGSRVLSTTVRGYPGSQIIGYAPFVKSHPKETIAVLQAILQGIRLFKNEPALAEANIRKDEKGALSSTQIADAYRYAAHLMTTSIRPTVDSERLILRSLRGLGGSIGSLAGKAHVKSLMSPRYAAKAEESLVRKKQH